MSEPRVPSGGLRELGPINWVICKVISTGAGTKDAHLFSTLGQAGGLFRAWLHYSARLMPLGKLSRYETELVILRIAHLRGSDYERDHHVRLGSKVGIDADAVERIEVGPSADWSENHRALLTAVDELVATKAITDTTWLQLSKHYDSRRLIEICLLTTQYDGLATVIETLGVQRDFG